jgi:DNA-binding GntR family transcriptional regulator
MVQLYNIKTTGSLTERAYETLKTSILDLDLKPGELIDVEDISAQLEISRTPIRTALNKLMEEELVEMIPGKGTFVTRLTEKQVIDLFNVRELLECYSVRLATELRSEVDLENLQYILNKQELTFNIRNGHKEFLMYDAEFHSLISKISNNTYLEKQLSLMHVNCMRYLNASSQDKVHKAALEEHKELFEQIRNKNVDKAILSMRKHIDKMKLRINDYIL